MKEGVELGSLCGSSANKNLTIGNLVRGSIPLITWCCVCKASTESVGHLLHNFYFVDYLYLLFVTKYLISSIGYDTFFGNECCLSRVKDIYTLHAVFLFYFFNFRYSIC